MLYCYQLISLLKIYLYLYYKFQSVKIYLFTIYLKRKNKKRIRVTLDKENLEIIQKVSKENRHTVSDTINFLIEKYFKK